MLVIYRKIRHARYLYIKRNVEKVWGARYLSKNTVSCVRQEHTLYSNLLNTRGMTNLMITNGSGTVTKQHEGATVKATDILAGQQTPWSRALLDSPTVPHISTNLPAFYAVRMFITVELRSVPSPWGVYKLIN